MSTPTTTSRTRLGAAAALLGAGAALTALVGVGPVPSVFQLSGATEDVRGSCDEAEHAADPACAGTLTAGSASDDTTGNTAGSTTLAVANGDVRTVNAGAAGSIMVSVDGSNLLLLTASPNQGWQVEVERASGPEIEVSFRSGSARVDVNVELEDGQMRERVRTRDDATGVQATSSDDSSGDSSDDSADDNSGSSDDDATEIDDSSGPGSGSDDSIDDDSGPGSDDSADDSSGSGSGSDDSSGHGTDDGPAHD